MKRPLKKVRKMRSMTGYANEFRSTEKYDVSMELKSVNSRYFEFKLKSYSSVDEWENEIKNIVFEKLKRGKIDCYIKIVEKNAQNYNIVVNHELAKKYEEALVSLSRTVSIVPELTLKDFVSLGNVLQTERIGGYEDLFELLKEILESLIQKTLVMMNVEGEKTKEDIENSLEIISKSRQLIEGYYPASLEKYKKLLKERMQELFPQNAEDLFTNNRFLMEIEMVASRSAINEEMVRLSSHISQFKNSLSGKVNGDSKKLDFISQEMNREVNTIASKSSDYEIIQNTIIMKSEIEKIREQLRNLE
jgi:uncharacterized protein (TIGR00255 family)